MAKLRLHVEGEHGAVTFGAFVDMLNRARLILNELDSAISENPKGALTWRITDLGVSSADAVIEAPPPDDFEKLPELVTANFVGGFEAVERGSDAVPPYFSETSLRRVRSISQRVGRGGVEGFEVTDEASESTATITERAGASVRELLAPRYTSQGSILGTLGMISVRKALVFNVYDAISHRGVRCRFDEAQFETVREALRRRVIVAGTVHRNANGNPISVERPELTVLPSEEASIATETIAGIDPGFTAGLPSGEYVKRLRD